MVVSNPERLGLFVTCWLVTCFLAATPANAAPEVWEASTFSLEKPQRMERGSFLRKPALSRWQFTEQARNDGIVMRRYTRHFNASNAEVIRYFSTFRAETLRETRKYDVWHVEPDGSLEKKRLTLRKGTKVWVDERNRIAMKANCGNPMVDDIPSGSGRPQRVVATPKPNESVSPPKSEPPVAVTPPVEEPPVVEPPIVPPTPPVIPIVPPVVPAIPATPVIPPESIIPAAPIPQSGGDSFNPLFAVPLLAGLALSSNGGGSGGGGNPVPEPTSILAIGTGIAGLAAARRRRNRP